MRANSSVTHNLFVRVTVEQNYHNLSQPSSSLPSAYIKTINVEAVTLFN